MELPDIVAVKTLGDRRFLSPLTILVSVKVIVDPSTVPSTSRTISDFPLAWVQIPWNDFWDCREMTSDADVPPFTVPDHTLPGRRASGTAVSFGLEAAARACSASAWAL